VVAARPFLFVKEKLMKPFEINAETRNDQGKGASRRLRHAGKIPAIVYGAHKDPVSVQLSQNEMRKHLEQEAFYSHILTLNLDGANEKVVLKALQRHPYKPQLLHADFMRIDESERITLRVPIHFINEDKCVGVKLESAVVSHLATELEVVCLPKDLPEYIEVDLADMHVGTTVHLADLTMPAGVEISALVHHGDASQPVVSVHLQKGATEAEGEEAAPGAAPAA
jgi:large subunit ribosomal protein L25